MSLTFTSLTAARRRPHVRGDGQIGPTAPASPDRTGGDRLHRLLAGGAGSPGLPDMEWTHVLRKVWPHGRWHNPEERDAARTEWRARREDWRAWKRGHRWGQAPASGNVAFDEYREETLRKLDEEQREFRDYLDKLRSAKDRAEFEQFMAERRNRPPATEPPQA